VRLFSDQTFDQLHSMALDPLRDGGLHPQLRLCRTTPRPTSCWGRATRCPEEPEPTKVSHKSQVSVPWGPSGARAHPWETPWVRPGDAAWGCRRCALGAAWCLGVPLRCRGAARGCPGVCHTVRPGSTLVVPGVYPGCTINGRAVDEVRWAWRGNGCSLGGAQGSHPWCWRWSRGAFEVVAEKETRGRRRDRPQRVPRREAAGGDQPEAAALQVGTPHAPWSPHPCTLHSTGSCWRHRPRSCSSSGVAARPPLAEPPPCTLHSAPSILLSAFCILYHAGPNKSGPWGGAWVGVHWGRADGCSGRIWDAGAAGGVRAPRARAGAVRKVPGDFHCGGGPHEEHVPAHVQGQGPTSLVNPGCEQLFLGLDTWAACKVQEGAPLECLWVSYGV